MKKEAVIIAVIVAASGILATTARAQFCLDFLFFCDGLELTISGDTISGYWRNVDCDGRDVPVVGVVREGIPNPCPPFDPGRAGVACLPGLGCDANGDDWYFVFNEPNGIVYMGYEPFNDPPPGVCAFHGGVSYQVLPGPCPFFQDQPGRPSISSAQAVR